MPTNRHTPYPTIHNVGYASPCPLTDESPWGGFSCPYNAMTQWDMILSYNGEWVEKFIHNPLGFTPQWEYNICGRKSDNKRIRPHNGTIPQWGKYHNAENPTHTLHEPMKVRGEDNYAPTMPYTMTYWEWAMSGENQTI